MMLGRWQGMARGVAAAMTIAVRTMSTRNARGQSWHVTLMALKSYNEQHGHLQVPQSFVVADSTSTDDTTTWPPETKGLKLGKVVNRLRVALKKNTLTEEQQKDLNDVGFEYVARVTWSDKLTALKLYHSINGHTNVPTSFKVPLDDPNWPSHLAGIPLGTVVKGLRFHREALPKPRRAQLDQVGFVWSSWDLSWKKRMLALQTYRDIHGDLDVPPEFTVPEGDPKWPAPTWGLKLYTAVRNIQSRSHRLNFEQLDELHQLGFQWDKVEFTFACRADAWKLYCDMHQSRHVPESFVVPRDAPWPRRMWDLPLGRVVGAVLSKPTRLTLQQLSYLHKLGLLPQEVINVVG
ncbi:hypothetical protein H310_11909 [Aphanomyces invadans]|uniref:Helicase-associated domain-containing protein n=1 Tax=Aphanomyces invadans TaxID=157072 RepID=A0A024TJ97_9STRA|nr:hypothetical protein H310_11909 [Aphanomyces invadans]ETV94230.1 hypothetical protein H310_11909 [Aphanomyces invadans]|eukprot:XP_008876992.1 hypothetical protein H310_11909 [Aphanomyces invadans]